MNCEVYTNCEVSANNYNLKCLRTSVLSIMVVLIFNELEIFVVEKSLVRISIAIATCILLGTLIAFRFISLEKKWAKYIIITSEIVAIYVLCVFMTYHIMLAIAFPFLMAGHYRERRVTWYTYIVSVICMILAVILGYQLGLCDMNMVAMTHGVVWDYGKSVRFEIKHLDANYIGQLLLFFALPRCTILWIYSRMALSIAQSGREMLEYRMQVENSGKYDKMTGLYNKNEYLYTMKNKYSSLERVGIIYFDINGLKEINDKYGHEEGDVVINTVTDSIKAILTDRINAYRVGGDEFIVVVDDSSQNEIVNLIERWKKILAVYNSNSGKYYCEVAVGCACGCGNNIEEVVELADKNMYEDKKNKKKSRIVEDKTLEK